jgi:hypothetical protein
MGALTSDIGYTSVITGREDNEIYVDMWGYWKKKYVPSFPNIK